MDIISVILIMVFIVAPAIVIYSSFSRIGSGIYHWADRQHPQPQYDYHPQPKPKREVVTTHDPVQDYWIEQSNKATHALQTPPRTRSKRSEARRHETPPPSPDEVLEQYLGYDPEIEDSPELDAMLRHSRFDVRDHLEK